MRRINVSLQKLLKSEYGMNEKDAKAITNAIVDNPEIYDVDEAFSVVKGGIVPPSHRETFTWFI